MINNKSNTANTLHNAYNIHVHVAYPAGYSLHHSHTLHILHIYIYIYSPSKSPATDYQTQILILS